MGLKVGRPVAQAGLQHLGLNQSTQAEHTWPLQAHSHVDLVEQGRALWAQSVSEAPTRQVQACLCLPQGGAKENSFRAQGPGPRAASPQGVI